MPATSLQTFVAIASLMGALMALVLFFIRKSYPASIQGLDDWSVFPTLSIFAAALYTTQGHWHHLLSMALPNLLVVLIAVLQLRGTYRHFQRPVNHRLLAAVVLGALVFILATSGEAAYYVHRLAFLSGFVGLMFGAQLHVLWRHRQRSFAAHFTLFTLVGLCGVMGLRAVTALLEPPPLGIYSYSPMQAVYLASYSFGILLLSISAILLATEQLRGELERLLKHDTLTGALTRRAAFEHAADEMARCARTGASFSVLLLDLDHFKDINDRYGHQAGDRVLAEFVHRVEAVLRRPAALGRYGGEEFLVVLPDTDPAQARQVAERIRQRLREGTAEPRVTASIGVATFRGGHDTLDAVIGRGDAALYAAKHQGRDRIEVEAPAA